MQVNVWLVCVKGLEVECAVTDIPWSPYYASSVCMYVFVCVERLACSARVTDAI